jgi:hypothetical protein
MSLKSFGSIALFSSMAGLAVACGSTPSEHPETTTNYVFRTLEPQSNVPVDPAVGQNLRAVFDAHVNVAVMDVTASTASSEAGGCTTEVFRHRVTPDPLVTFEFMRRTCSKSIVFVRNYRGLLPATGDTLLLNSDEYFADEMLDERAPAERQNGIVSHHAEYSRGIVRFDRSDMNLDGKVDFWSEPASDTTFDGSAYAKLGFRVQNNVAVLEPKTFLSVTRKDSNFDGLGDIEYAVARDGIPIVKPAGLAVPQSLFGYTL